jgi:hypothetical protein
MFFTVYAHYVDADGADIWKIVTEYFGWEQEKANVANSI